MLWRSQVSFAGGVISKKLYGRLDLDIYAMGAAEIKNFLVMPHGGLRNRSGSRFYKFTEDQRGQVITLPFEFSHEETFTIELYDLRLLVDGATFTTPWMDEEIREVDFVQTGTTMYFVHSKHPPQKLVKLESGWEFTEVPFLDGPYCLINVNDSHTMTPSAGTGTVTVLSSLDVFNALDVGRLMRIWNETASSWAWGEIVVVNSATSADVAVVGGEFPAAATDLWKLGKFSYKTGFPSTVTLYEMRLWLAGVKEKPQDIEGSKVNFLEDFGTSPDDQLLATDAVSFSLYSDHIDDIVWLRQNNHGLLAGTSGGVWSITGSSGPQSPITPASISARRILVNKCHPTVKPVQIENALLFLAKDGERIFELLYSWKDSGMVSNDVTLLAETLFDGLEVTRMTVNEPDKLIWCCMSDGTLRALTYMREEGVLAWHIHTTEGTVEDVCSISRGKLDRVHLVVSRNGKKYVEVLEPEHNKFISYEGFFVDCGITVEASSPTRIVSGLDHLEDLVVTGTADGKVFPPRTVRAGRIIIPFDAQRFHVGLPIDARILTLPLEIPSLKSGPSLGRMKDVMGIMLLVTDSYGCKIGRDYDNLEEVIFNEELIMGTAPELFDGIKNIDTIGGQPDRDIRVAIVQDIPLPLTLNSLVTDVTVLEA